MGRQPHVTSLALGRSPFGDPLRDENGDFILGPHAHDNDGPGYHQEFDERGHPQNHTSRAHARRVRKAQNDVLATVGVVVKKGEERKSKWERLEDDEKIDIISRENVTGIYLKNEDRVLGAMLSWPITSLRNRLMVLMHYNSLSMTAISLKEYRSTGLVDLLFAGHPTYCLSSLPRYFRYYFCYDPSADGLVNYVNPWREDDWYETTYEAVRRHFLTTMIKLIELPLLTHTTLQSLRITPSNTMPTLSSFVPFTSMSPIVIPSTIAVHTLEGALTAGISVCRSPFVLYLIHDYLQLEIGFRLYGLFRQLLTKPDRPDMSSAKASDGADDIEETSIPGMGVAWPQRAYFYQPGKRSFGPRSFLGALRLAFPPIFQALNWWKGGKLARSRGRLTRLLERQLRRAVRDRYWRERTNLEPIPRRGTPEDINYRLYIVKDVFDDANLNPEDELVDFAAWANDTLGLKADVLLHQTLTTDTESSQQPADSQEEITPDPEQNEIVGNLIAEAFRLMPVSDAIVIQASNGNVVVLNQNGPSGHPNYVEPENISTLEATDVPLQALVQGVRDWASEHNEEAQPAEQPEELESSNRPTIPSPPAPSTPTPGIRRARSLVDPESHDASQINLRPRRRPTETDDSLAAISETLRVEAGALQSPRPSSRPSPRGLSPVTERDAPFVPFHLSMEFNEPIRDPPLVVQKHSLYRVTMLSNFAADSIAWHGSAILTSFILWPVEAIWLRSVATWTLENPAMRSMVDPWWAARLGFSVVGRPVGVLGLGTWFGGASSPAGRMRYMGNVLMTLGLEGMVRGVLWRAGVWYVKRCAQRYGWGQF